MPHCTINIKIEKNTEQRESQCPSAVKHRLPCGMGHFHGTPKQGCNAISGEDKRKHFDQVAISSLDFAQTEQLQWLQGLSLTIWQTQKIRSTPIVKSGIIILKIYAIKLGTPDYPAQA